ncbi:hypothetical protein [uncultured Fibrella sp.]|uniref:hypothetical protein n=1 Tax=uncultured Fibrella sp. TaxID=1284596 RepID=UPI0035C9D833
MATLYGLYLQRVHNEKSLKPLGQIDLPDYKNQIAIHIRNNGLGPLIIDRLTFSKSDNIYSSIEECLDLDPRSYMHIPIYDTVKRIILPNSYLMVFEKNFRDDADEADRNHIRRKLSTVTLKVDCRDIYDNKFTIERDFNWFTRHLLQSGVDP